MGNAFTLLLIFGVAVTGVFLLFRHPLLYLFGASDATYPYAEAYMTIYLLGTVFVMIGLGMNPFITSQGFGRTGMMTVGLGRWSTSCWIRSSSSPWTWGCGARRWPP